MKKINLILFMFMVGGCSGTKQYSSEEKVKIITLDPGHFHSALVQKSMYDDVDSTVHVYAPDGDELKAHLSLVEQYNNDKENPTGWNTVIYTGDDFFSKMLEEKSGNVVMLAGNNQRKTDYIEKSIIGGFNVLADKPMAIDKNSFEVLKKSFDKARERDLLLYDIMTERYEITTMLQREFSLIPEVFGIQEKGTPENPAVTKESVHHFYKYVSGNALTRPAWFFDVDQEGEGIVDVTTHLVDLIQWECFPDEIIDYKKDIELVSAKRWSTDLTLDQFNSITKLEKLPSYLEKDLTNDNILKVFSNGEINYRLKGVHAKVLVTWAYQAPEGTGDTHYSIMRGSKANLIIEQGVEQKYKPALYIEPINGKDEAFEIVLTKKVRDLQEHYPGIGIKEVEKGWEVLIPEKYKEGHEAHFARVTEKFLEYMKNGNMPEWEVPNMISKYYTTTSALALAKETSN
jgi:predicted dehydrogenase